MFLTTRILLSFVTDTETTTPVATTTPKTPPKNTATENGNMFYDVKELLDHRVEEDATYYLVRWEGGFPDTWEPDYYVLPDLKASYKAQSKRRSQKKKTRSLKSKPRKTESKPQCVLQLGIMPVNSLGFDAKLYNKTSLLGLLFGKDRILEYKVNLKMSKQLTWGKQHTIDGITFELAACRVSKLATQGRFGRSYEVTATMVAVSGPDLQPISLANELNAVADFASLSPVKAKARLELLDSGTNRKAICHWKPNKLEIVPECNNLGCGFYPADEWAVLFGSKGRKQQVGHQIVQVRILCPQFGLFKGVLCPKLGIDKIQLPSSMLKVGPAKCKYHKGREQSQRVYVVVKNQFPTNASKNLVNQWNSKEKSEAGNRRFGWERQDPGVMHFRMWNTHGVTIEECGAYAQRCNNPSLKGGVKHAYLVGVADPTGNLPANKIFVPGLAEHIESLEKKQVYITRSPCLEPDDGRLIGFVYEKPKRMSEEDWNFINNLPFGSVIFGPPATGAEKAMPETIADG